MAAVSPTFMLTALTLPANGGLQSRIVQVELSRLQGRQSLLDGCLLGLDVGGQVGDALQVQVSLHLRDGLPLGLEVVAGGWVQRRGQLRPGLLHGLPSRQHVGFEGRKELVELCLGGAHCRRDPRLTQLSAAERFQGWAGLRREGVGECSPSDRPYGGRSAGDR